MKAKKRRLKKFNLVVLLVSTLCFIGFFISIFNIVKWKLDSNKTITEVKDIQDIVEIKEIEDDENVKLIEQTEKMPSDNPYWKYIKFNLIDVDFTELKETNSSTVGWIQVSGTNINYPFVKANDNKYYLTHSFNKSYNLAGWVFLDYRNSKNVLDKNNIIYAHSRRDRTMFGSLKNILTSGWLKDTNNYTIKVSTETENTLWQVFSVYHIPTTSDYIQVNFNSNEEFKTWTQMLIDRSAHNFKTTVNENDKVLTLSTCYSNNEKLVLHAKLIKSSSKQ